jgi:hypothetical protein
LKIFSHIPAEGWFTLVVIAMLWGYALLAAGAAAGLLR